jgi:hypothetical protein
VTPECRKGRGAGIHSSCFLGGQFGLSSTSVRLLLPAIVLPGALALPGDARLVPQLAYPIHRIAAIR